MSKATPTLTHEPIDQEHHTQAAMPDPESILWELARQRAAGLCEVLAVIAHRRAASSDRYWLMLEARTVCNEFRTGLEKQVEEVLAGWTGTKDGEGP